MRCARLAPIFFSISFPFFTSGEVTLASPASHFCSFKLMSLPFCF